MSLKACATSRCSVEPSGSARASRSPASTRRAALASRWSGRASVPASTQANPSPRASDRADADEPADVAPDPPVDRVDALRYPNGAADVTPDHDRNRGVQERLAQRVAEPSALSDPPVERCRDLGPVS